MKYEIREYKESDEQTVIDIFNYYVRESFAAYAEEEIKPEFFRQFIADAVSFIVLEIDGKVSGFGILKPYMKYETFQHTGVLAYSMMPPYTGKGFGTMILDKLIDAGRQKQITNLLANISSKNYTGLRFHKKHGFRECGRLKGVGRKFNESFDIVWVQKIIDY